MKRDSVVAYKLMVLYYKLVDFFGKPGQILHQFNIQNDMTVVDYGCGPGRHLKTASELVGENGIVFAVDINKTAIDNVEKRIKEYNLKNVVPILLSNGRKLEEECADLIYALDMFHQVEDASSFLGEIFCIIKKDGCFYLDDGHQSRESTKYKIKQSTLWEIEKESKEYLKLRPKKNDYSEYKTTGRPIYQRPISA